MWDIKIITYHHALQLTSMVTHSNDTDLLVAFSILATQLTYQLF